MVKVQLVLGSPTGPTASAGGARSPGIVRFWSLSKKVGADNAVFSALSRCQHLKVNNMQEGSGVRAASGLSLSPQTKPVRAQVWPVWNAERSWATAAPFPDIASNPPRLWTVTEEGATSCKSSPRARSTLWSNLLQVTVPFSGKPGPAKWKRDLLPIYHRRKRSGNGGGGGGVLRAEISRPPKTAESSWDLDAASCTGTCSTAVTGICRIVS